MEGSSEDRGREQESERDVERKRERDKGKDRERDNDRARRRGGERDREDRRYRKGERKEEGGTERHNIEREEDYRERARYREERDVDGKGKHKERHHHRDDDHRHSVRQRSRSRSRSPPSRRHHRRHDRDSDRSSSGSESGSESEEARRARKKRERRHREEEYDSDYERRRRRKKRETSEERAERKRRKREKKQSKRGHKSGIVIDYGKHGIISEADVTSRLTSEFRQWLVEEKHINPETISRSAERKEMSSFIEDYNTATMPSEKYYNLEAHERRMEMIRAGETVEDGGYDPLADEAAAKASYRAQRRAEESSRGTPAQWQSKEQLEALRRVQMERIEAAKMKQLGLQTSASMGVRMDGTEFDRR